MDVRSVLGLIRRRVWAVLLCLAVGLGGGVAAWKKTTPEYRSSSSVLLGLPGAQTPQEALQGIQISSQLLQSYADIVSSLSLADDVKQRLNLPDSPKSVSGKLSGAIRPQTLYIVVSATDPDRIRSRSLADAATASLIDRIADLQKTRSKDTAITATVIDVAQPGSRISPRPKLDVGLGLTLGLIMGLLLAIAVDAADRTVKTAGQLSGILQAPTLGVIPRTRGRRLIEAPMPRDVLGEAYRAVRTAVRFSNPGGSLATVAITSAHEGEGKTTTAANLAVALADSGERVLLVDADLRRAGLAPALGLEGAVGLSNLIVGQVTLEEALQEWAGVLTVLPAGTLPPNPSELLGSQAMGDLLDELQHRFDVVVLDSPPVLPVTDAVVLSQLVDGVVIVGRAGHTTRASVNEIHKRLETVKAPVLGCILNAAPASQLTYEDYQALSAGG